MFSDIPLFFKIWFAFVFTLAISVWGGAIFLIYKFFTDPHSIGVFIGKILDGISSVN